MKLTYQEIIDSDLPLDELWHRVSEHIKKLEEIIDMQSIALNDIERRCEEVLSPSIVLDYIYFAREKAKRIRSAI